MVFLCFMQYLKLSDKDLLKRSRRGDTEAFGEIVSRDSDYIFGWIIQRTRNEFAAEELFQITLIKCWNNIKKFKGDSSFRTWACAVARNLFIDEYRRLQKRNEESFDFSVEGKERLTKAMIDLDPLEKFKNEDLKIFLDEIMSELSASHRNVLHHFAVGELTCKEISKIEKCSVGTVMSRLFYARKKAQGLISERKDCKDYGID